MIIFDKDIETKDKFVKCLNKEIKSLKSTIAHDFKRIKECEEQIKVLREILDALEASELIDKELNKQ